MHLQDNPFASANDLNGICDILQGIAAAGGHTYFSYLLLDGGRLCTRLVSNYPTAWCDRYEQKLYIHYDPVVTLGRESRLPFFWNHGRFLQPYSKAQRKVFHEAGDFGINYGYAIPIAGGRGESGLFSVAAPQEGPLIDAMSASMHLVYVLGLQVHDRVLSLTTDASARMPHIDLTARELECLKWAAEGLTTEQIADRMAISAATVNYHFNKIVPKFDAANRHHAAIRAVRMGLI